MAAKQATAQFAPRTAKPSVIDDLFDLAAAGSLDEILGRALGMTTRMVGAEAGSICFQAQSDFPRFRRAGAFRSEALARIQRWESVISRRLQNHTWHIYRPSPAIISQTSITGQSVTIANIPLLHKTQVVGMLSLVLAPEHVLNETQGGLLVRIAQGVGQIASTVYELEVTQRRLHRLSAFYDVGQALVTTFDINELLSNTMSLAANIIDAGAASIMLVDEAEQELVFRVSHGAYADVMRRHRIPMDEGIAGWVARTGRPVIANDARADARFSHRVDVRTGFLTQSIAAVPLKIKGQVIGVLEVLNKYSGEGFTQDDIQLLSIVATQTAIAIENARLYHRLHQERDQVVRVQGGTHQEITGKLHDGVLQYLSAISLSLDHLKILSAKPNPDMLVHQIAALQTLVQQATKNTRSLLLELRPPMLETEGLVAACRYFVKQFSNASGFDIHLTTPAYPLNLDQKTNVAIFSIVQEALNNVICHANASHVWVELSRGKKRLTTTIQDDGRGFNLAALHTLDSQLHRGLANMKKLAAAINADLKIESSTRPPHRGTTIRITLPISSEKG